jgi:Dolichyl-phosphate-mannose-protein mannosyltransferase
MSTQASAPSTAASSTRGLAGWPGLCLVIGLYLVAVAAVNPLRECPVLDDWAYASTVRHLLQAGEYKLDDWVAPNMPFQALWGALFGLVLGDSYVSFRLSTIALTIIGLIAFRALAREHGLSGMASNLVTLCLASSSLFFRMSLTFQTDIPFLVTLIVALFFYTRALRVMSVPAWVAAAVAGAASILTRQFGAALVAALGVLWLFDRQRIARLKFYSLGLSLPLIAVAWQLFRGLFYSNWAAESVLFRQKLFFSQGHFLHVLPWRPLVLLEYQALWLVPLVLLAAWAALGDLLAIARKGGVHGPETPRAISRRASVAWFVGLLALFAGGVVYGWKVVGYGYNSSDFHGSTALMPFLRHTYDLLLVLGEPIRWAVTIYVVIGAALIAGVFVERYARLLSSRVQALADKPPDFGELSRAVPPAAPRELFLDLTSLFLLSCNLIFFQQWDSYQLPFLPLVAIVLAKRFESLLVSWRWAVAACCLALLAGSVIWTREDLAKGDVQWILAERLRQSGVAPQNIASSWEWFAYWNFPEFVRQEGKQASNEIPNFLGEEGWQGRNRQAAEYWIVHNPKPPAGSGETWMIVGEADYFSFYSRGRERFYAVRRSPVRDHGGPK